jgi:hypothetical protein
MLKLTVAPGATAPVASVTWKTTVEVVGWPEPCTPIDAGVAEMN